VEETDGIARVETPAGLVESREVSNRALQGLPGGLELALLEQEYDVDDAADWQRLVEDLAAGRKGAPAVRAFVLARQAAGR